MKNAANVWSNLAFPLCGVLAVLIAPGVETVLYALSITLVGVFSGVWHWTERHPHNVWDRYSIFGLFSVLLSVAVGFVWAFPVVFGIAYYADRVTKNSFLVIGALALIVVLRLVLIGAYLEAGAGVLIGAGAVLLNVRDHPSMTGPRHPVWHVLAAALTLVFLLPFVL